MKKVRLLHVILILVLLIGLGYVIVNGNNSPKTRLMTVDPKTDPDSPLPIHFEAYGNPYSIREYEVIPKNDTKTTWIYIYGFGYGIDYYNPYQNPIICSYESNGYFYEGKMYFIDKNKSITFSFDTVLQPEIITITNRDTDEIILSFNVTDIPPRNYD